MELAADLMPPNGPYTKSQLARALDFHRASFYWQKKRSVYRGLAAHIAPHVVRELQENADAEVLFSAIFELQLADGSKVRGCFALWKRTRHILALTFDYRMQAELVVSTVRSLQFCVPGMIWHSDQGSQYGAEQTRTVLARARLSTLDESSWNSNR